jgi:hypothetical protein
MTWLQERLEKSDSGELVFRYRRFAPKGIFNCFDVELRKNVNLGQ